MTQSFTMRASSVATLFDCAHRWEWQHMYKRFKPASVRTLLGTAIHAGTAAYDLARMNGHRDFTMHDAADHFRQALLHPEEDVDYYGDDLRINEAEIIGLKLILKYCRDIAPLFTFVDVERKLARMTIDCGGGVDLTLTGTMDRARVFETDDGSSRSIVDVKSGRRSISQGEVVLRPHLAQLGTYQIMDQAESPITTDSAGVIALSTDGKAQAAVSPLIDCRPMMYGVEETQDAPEQKGYIHYAADMFRTGHFPPNPKSGLCSKRWCSRWDNCLFHE